jgi:predicted dehydrogenase
VLKAAVIGVGAIGQNHARVYRSIFGVTLVGVADTNEAAAARVGTFNHVPYYSDVDALLNEQKPDLVTIAVPTSLHYQMGRKLIERGIHVLMEKPIASTLSQAAELVELAAQRRTVLAVGHIERFNPAVMELRKQLAAHTIGRVYKIFAQRLSPYPPRIRDAGVVIDLASHDIDLMRYLVAEPVLRLVAETHQGINSDREDIFVGVMRFRDGIIGVLDVNWMTPTKVRKLTVTGALGFYECDLLRQELFFYENDSAPSQWDALSVLHGVSEGNVLGIRINRHEPLAAEIQDFVNAVVQGGTPTVTGQDGLETLRIALAFVKSGTDGRGLTAEELQDVE